MAPGFDGADLDKDFDQLEDEFFTTKIKIQGYRREFDKAQLPAQPAVVQANNNDQNRRSKIDYRKPERLKEHTDLKDFLRWKPTWTNYATLVDLAQLNRDKQVGIFWDCCTPGFLNTMKHSLQIPMDTGRTVDDIHRMIEDHLRSLRDKNIDMKSLIEVKQAKGQDYTSLCNEIRDKALFADTRNVTEDILLIAVLVKAVQDTTDVQEVLKSKPRTFDEARKALLALECAKKCAQSLQGGHKEIGAMLRPNMKL